MVCVWKPQFASGVCVFLQFACTTQAEWQCSNVGVAGECDQLSYVSLLLFGLVHTRACVHTHTHTHTHTYTHTHTNTHTQTHTLRFRLEHRKHKGHFWVVESYMHTHTHTITHTKTHHIGTHTHTQTYTHIHTHINSGSNTTHLLAASG